MAETAVRITITDIAKMADAEHFALEVILPAGEKDVEADLSRLCAVAQHRCHREPLR